MVQPLDLLAFISEFNRMAVKFTNLLDMKEPDIPIRKLTLYRGPAHNRVEMGRIAAPANVTIRLFYSAAIPYGAKEYEIDEELLQKARALFSDAQVLTNSHPQFNILEHILLVSCVGDIKWKPRTNEGAS